MNRIDQSSAPAEQDSAVFWQHPHFQDMGLLKARFRRHRYELHTHPSYVIALITDGCESVRVNGRRETAPTNAIILVNPEECHDGEAGCDAGWAYRTFYPNVGLMTAIAEEVEQPRLPWFPRAIVTDNVLADLLWRAHHLAEAGPPIAAETAMLAALRHLIARHADHRDKARRRSMDGAVGRMIIYRDMIEADVAAPYTLAQFAAAAGVTRFQVVRDFKQATGFTPSAYMRNRRVLWACQRINDGEPLVSAAIQAGFADQSHFNRAFKRSNGFTPGALRHAIRNTKP